MDGRHSLRPQCLGSALAALVVLIACGDDRITAPPEEEEEDSAESTAFVQVTAGGAHSCARDTAGVVHCWGRNQEGQLGLGDIGQIGVHEPAQIESGQEFVAVAAGDFHTCALDVAGAAHCWGLNDDGQLGDSTREARAGPVPVSGGHTYTMVTVGGAHSCGLIDATHARCWGDNSFTQLGDAATADRDFPAGVELPSDLEVTEIEAGGGHTCAAGITASQATLYCWGNNGTGQLGDSTTTTQDTPVEVVGSSAIGFEGVTAGGVHSCAWIPSTAVADCWGFNLFGQHGDGTNVDSRSPLDGDDVAGDLGFSVLSAGADHTCGIADGVAYCWGFNGDGRLGDGTRTDRNQPTRVSGDLTFADISAGLLHTCGVTTDEEVWCWGANADGQLGDGTTEPSEVPVRAGSS